MNHSVKFVSLRVPLTGLIGRSPSGFDITEMRNYWISLDQIASSIENAQEKNGLIQYGKKHLNFAVDHGRMRIIAIPQNYLRADEKWSIFLRAPKVWFNIYSAKKQWFRGMQESGLYRLRRGFTTNANELYYLPSKHWKVAAERQNAYHILRASTELVMPRSIVKQVAKSPTTLTKYRVEKSNLKRILVYLQKPKEEIKSQAVLMYIDWIENYVASEFLTNDRFPTIAKKMFAPELALRVNTIAGIFAPTITPLHWASAGLWL